MRGKTSELAGKALDWAVAKYEGALAPMGNLHFVGNTLFIAVGGDLGPPGEWVSYQPSTDWSQGGPIIEREGICLKKGHSGWWIAKLLDVNDEEHFVTVAPTPLIAAMRCYVMSKLGDTVDIPEEVR